MTAPPTRPQPIYEELELRVDPEPVHRAMRDAETRDEFRSGRVVAWIIASWILAMVVIAIVVLLITTRSAAPRSAPDPTAPQPGASAGDVVSDGASAAQVQASTSDRAPSRAPLERSEDRVPLPFRDDGGAPLTWSGKASWYDDGPGLYAAVHSYRFGDPTYTVRVCRRDARNTCVLVTVRDHMKSTSKAIDLGPDAFVRLWPGIDRQKALYTYGVVDVVVETGMPEVTQPPTDVAP